MTGWARSGVLALMVGCTRPPAPLIDQLRLETSMGLEVASATPESVVAQFRRRLEQQRFVFVERAPTEGERPVWRVTLSAQLAEPSIDRGPIGRASASSAWRRRGADDTFEIEAHDTVKAGSNRLDDIEAASSQALGNVMSALAEQARALIELSPAEDAKVLEVLAGAPSPSRSAALVVLAQRHHPAALAPLVAQLETDDPLALRRTVGLLVELKDPRAVPALIDVSHARDPVLQREIVFAVAALGGNEAKAYLWSVAQGHDDPVVRASAEQALKELTARGSP